MSVGVDPPASPLAITHDPSAASPIVACVATISLVANQLIDEVKLLGAVLANHARIRIASEAVRMGVLVEGRNAEEPHPLLADVPDNPLRALAEAPRDAAPLPMPESFIPA